MPKQAERTGSEPAGPHATQARAPQPHLKHWNLARDACTSDENPADYDRQLREFEDEIRPQNALEFTFVRQMADARWRLRRLVRLGFLGPVLNTNGRRNEVVDPRSTGTGDEGDLRHFGLDGIERPKALRRLDSYVRRTHRAFVMAKKQIAFLRGEGRCLVERR